MEESKGNVSKLTSSPHTREAKPKWLGFLLFIAFIFAACSNAGAQVPENPAPDFEITLFETETREKGEILRMSDLTGNPVVVNFWFPSCPPCVAEMPDLDKAFQKHKDSGVEFVGIQLVGLDTVEDGQDFVDNIGVTYALGPDEDGTLIRDYKVAGFPTTVFVDKNQSIVRTWTGILTAEKLDELMQEILN